MVSVLPFVWLLAVVAVVMMWRGIWGLLDEYLLPKNPKLSNLISFLIGLVIVGIILLTVPL